MFQKEKCAADMLPFLSFSVDLVPNWLDVVLLVLLAAE